MTKRGKKSIVPWLIFIGLVVIFGTATLVISYLIKDANMAVLNPKGQVASAEKDLLMFTLALSAVVVIPVFLMAGIFAWRYREGNTKAKYTPDNDSNHWLEALWWGIPILIILILSVVTWISTHQLDPQKPLDSKEKPIKIQVVALQWKWLFIYPEYDVASVNSFRMPVGVPVNFEITSDAPMSAFWIPNLGTQTYAMNGMTSKLSLVADEPGVYRGSNSNIAGEGYSDMHFTAETVPDRKAFQKWIESVNKNPDHAHLDAGVYEKLSKPSKVKTPYVMHLHDRGLYDTIISKYMSHGDSSSGGKYHNEH